MSKIPLGHINDQNDVIWRYMTRHLNKRGKLIMLLIDVYIDYNKKDFYLSCSFIYIMLFNNYGKRFSHLKSIQLQ